ncbi:hypothetical protein [Aquimarina algiphila]|uniref:hypothetical protein n=1 Tax=Aquimarina algiphila TaxID=2047982 RepID=UPI0023301DEF|nr:hypothetical protein [Aquimarina algiphila]
MLTNIKNVEGALIIEKQHQKNINGGDAPDGPWGDCPPGYRQCTAWGACLRNTIPCD